MDVEFEALPSVSRGRGGATLSDEVVKVKGVEARGTAAAAGDSGLNRRQAADS